MCAEEFLRSTPPEINIKIEAWNASQRRAAQRDYNFVVLMATAWHSPKKFPSFERFYPEKDPSTGQQKVDRQTAKAMDIAKRLGDI